MNQNMTSLRATSIKKNIPPIANSSGTQSVRCRRDGEDSELGPAVSEVRRQTRDQGRYTAALRSARYVLSAEEGSIVEHSGENRLISHSNGCTGYRGNTFMGEIPWTVKHLLHRQARYHWRAMSLIGKMGESGHFMSQ